MLRDATQSDDFILETVGLCKYFEMRRPFSMERYAVKAVDRVNLKIRRGEVFGLVGESGCGKSTIGRLLLRLLEASAGKIIFNGKDITTFRGAELATMRRDMQIVFQDPYSSLNPSFDVRTILWEGLSKVPGMTSQQSNQVMAELIAKVGLSPEYLPAHPHELSGGQRQRVGVARALSVNPQILIADEPTSALDVSIQAQILDLFISLQEQLGLAMLFISHDFSVIRYLCERVAVMYLGQIFEQGRTRDVLDNPCHPYTAGLLSSIPRIDQRGTRKRLLLSGELPSPTNLPTGCHFHPRCPFAQARCKVEEPLLEEHGSGHAVACFYPIES
jgi:oligopeptide/dipeptide ABC transporter ATP-binding protein